MPNIYKYIYTQLEPHYTTGEAQAIARIIVEDHLNYSFTQIVAGIAPAPTESQISDIDNIIERLLNDEPIQYILGKATFCSHEFIVTPATLIPRPETEQLVDIVSQFSNKDNCRLMDACTGSGCIAISIKKAHPAWQVDACDISNDALEIAQKNAEKLAADVKFFRTNILELDLRDSTYDIIVSNPPYVMNKEKVSMEKHVLNHEPQLALFVEDHEPLIFYNALVQWGRAHLATNGFLAVEINAMLAKETALLFEQYGYKNIRTVKDIFQKDRFIVCQR